MFGKKWYEYEVTFFKTMIVISYILYAVEYFTSSSIINKYLDNIQTGIIFYVAIFLMARFNPLKKIIFTELDQTVAFTAGVFIFTTTTIGKWLKSYFDLPFHLIDVLEIIK